MFAVLYLHLSDKSWSLLWINLANRMLSLAFLTDGDKEEKKNTKRGRKWNFIKRKFREELQLIAWWF